MPEPKETSISCRAIKSTALIFAVFSATFSAVNVQASQFIDLSEFYAAEPEVVVSSSGVSALFVESSVVTPVRLTINPAVGDGAVLSNSLQYLSFRYQFSEGPDAVDQFVAVIFDASLGPYEGTLEEFRLNTSGSGTFQFDLSRGTGRSLGVLFQLSELDRKNGTISSKLRISHLEQTDILFIDTDQDGMPDEYESAYSLDYLVDDSMEDPDEDRLTNYDEYLIGSHPFKKDTDGDGIDDADELDLGFDPLEPDECPESICPSSGGLIKIILLLRENGKLL